MISVIICHVNKEHLSRVKENIASTIGIDHELIIIDNTTNKYNIFQAYNEGVSRSKYDILCFVHEDVLFHTLSWGQLLVKHFEDAGIGLVGTIGGTAFPNVPAPWWNNTVLNRPHLNLIQHWKNLQPPKEWVREVINQEQNIIYQYQNTSGGIAVDAVTIDGVFMCARKEMFANGVAFDEKTFDGFHCYDTDICFQALNAGYRIVVVFDILLEHFSLGTININWIRSADKLADKWKARLPLFAHPIDRSLIDHYNHKALLTYSYWSQEVGIADKEIRSAIRRHYKVQSGRFVHKESLLLWLWMKFGYQFARYPYAALNRLYN